MTTVNSGGDTVVGGRVFLAALLIVAGLLCAVLVMTFYNVAPGGVVNAALLNQRTCYLGMSAVALLSGVIIAATGHK